MKLNDFVQEMSDELERFKTRWVAENKERGDDLYPMELNEGDWFLQYLAWITMNKEYED